MLHDEQMEDAEGGLAAPTGGAEKGKGQSTIVGDIKRNRVSNKEGVRDLGASHKHIKERKTEGEVEKSDRPGHRRSSRKLSPTLAKRKKSGGWRAESCITES